MLQAGVLYKISEKLTDQTEGWFTHEPCTRQAESLWLRNSKYKQVAWTSRHHDKTEKAVTITRTD